VVVKRRETAADRRRMARGLLDRLIADCGCVKGAGARVAGPPRQRPEQTLPEQTAQSARSGGRQRADEIAQLRVNSAAFVHRHGFELA